MTKRRCKKGQSEERGGKGFNDTSEQPDENGVTSSPLFTDGVRSSKSVNKMAASRLDPSRRLCVRYKYFFLGALIMLSIQLFISYSFVSISSQISKHEEVHIVESRIDANGGKGPPETGHNHNRLDRDARSHNSRQHPGDRQHDDSRAGTKTTSSQQKTVHCTTTSEMKSAIGRATTAQCKQDIAVLGCRLQDGDLYKKTLPQLCPNKGTDQGVYYGCYRDVASSRDLEGGMVDFPEDNHPQKCIDHCLRSGQKYAGLQYTKECWCGQKFGKHGPKLSESHCFGKCPGNTSETCGAYLSNKIYGTGAQEVTRQSAPLEYTPLEPTKPRVKVVFVLTVNGRAVRQVIRLIRVLYSPHHFYYIHVDKRQEYLFRELLPLQNRFPNVMLTTKRFSTIWGGASLLTAHLSFLKELMETKADWEWDYYINLSESDYPIKPLSELTDYLTAYKGLNFLKSHGGNTPRFIKKQGLDKTFYECDNHLWRIGSRKLPGGIIMDGGSDWVGLHRDFAHYVVYSTDGLVEGLKEMYRYALLPVESFFHTVLQNSEYCTKSVDNNLHLTNWRRKQGCQCQYKHIVDWCGCSPNDLKIHDLDKLLNFDHKPVFFARKFEAIVDQEIINSLDATLFGYMHQSIPSLTRYWQNVFHHLDQTTKVKDAALTIYSSLFRRSLAQLAQTDSKCLLKPVTVSEVNTYSQADHFHGLLVLGTTEVKATGESLTLEIHAEPKHHFSVVSPHGNAARLLSLEVGTNFDLKELLFRNYGNLMGPYDDISLRHEWGPGSKFTASFAWVDPTNVIAASYDVEIPSSFYVGNQMPILKKPLRPGIWSSKVMIDFKLVAEMQFLVTPLTLYDNKPVLSEDIHRIHSGPGGSYTSTDFSEFMPNLGLVDSPQMRLEAEANSKRMGEDLEQWVDSLTSLFWFMRQTCVLSSSSVCASIPVCNVSSWSSRSPDIKSDPKFIGSKVPLIR